MAQRPGLQRSYSIASTKTIVLITGGNHGIGYEIVKKLATEHPTTHHILMGCRDTHKGEAAVASMGAPLNVNPIQLDLTSDESIEHCFKTVEQIFGRLDVLINNAGNAGEFFPEDTTLRQRYQSIYDVNVFGAACLTEALIPLLSKSSLPKVIFTTSNLGSIQSLNDGSLGYFVDNAAYNSSKAALNYLCVFYAHKYPDWKVNAGCPGYRATGLNHLEKADWNDPALGAINITKLVLEGKEGKTGTFTDMDKTWPW